VVSLNLAHPVYLIGVSKNYIFKTYFAQISNFIFSWKLLLLSFLDIFLFLNLYCLIIMVNYADLLTVICLYSHSLRGSTVLPTIPWLRHRAFTHFIHHRLLKLGTCESFFSVRIKSRIESAVRFVFESNLRLESAVGYTTKAVTQPNGLQAHRTLQPVTLTANI